MKISKHVHSCLLIEESNTTVLIDPGNYSVEEGAIDVDKVKKLDYLLITHEHADHMDVPLVKSLAEKFPDVKIISNSSVAGILSKEGLKVATGSDNLVKVSSVPHEKIIGRETPKNVLFQVFDKLTHPGDSHSFNKTTEILALPVQAPWGSFVDACQLAVKLKPKVVIPIHDWHWNEKARKMQYKMAAEYLGKHGIEFKQVETGEIIEV